MIRTLRALFLSRLLREKILLLAFFGLGTLWWLSSFADRAARFVREERALGIELAIQQQWLDNRGLIEATAQKAASRLDPAQTRNSTRLFTEVSNLANEAGFRNAIINPQPPATIGQFSIHTLNFTVNNVDWEALKKFYLALQAKAPYVGIDQFSLNNPGNNTHTLGMRISSVEIAR
jgi:hypothetical protein